MAMADTTCVFVAARQGPKNFQKHTLAEFAASTTLRAIGHSIMPGVQLLHVEAAKEIDGKIAEFAGDMLDKPVGFVVNTAGLMYVKCCFDSDSMASTAMDGKKQNQDRFQAMMEDKRRHTQHHWPQLYPCLENKQAIRSIANGIIQAGRSDTATHGGFSSKEVADASRSQIWALAEVLNSVVRRAGTMARRSMPIPLVFLEIAEPVWIQSSDPAEVEIEEGDETTGLQEQLARHGRVLQNILQHSGILSSQFRMSAVIETLAENVRRFLAYLVNNSQAKRDARSEDVPAPQNHNLDYHRILHSERPALERFSSDYKATVARIQDVLHKSGPYQPVRIDKLLVTDAEIANNTRARQVINRRLQWVIETAKFDVDVQLYRYKIGSHFGIYNYLWLLPVGDEEKWEAESLKSLTRLQENLPRHLSRKYHRKFAAKYSNLSNMSASLRRDLLRVVCGDASAGEHGAADRARDARLQLWLDADPELADEITVDLRRLNKSESSYDKFWEIMGKFLDEHDMKVNERRHGSTCETPFAWSIKSLKQDIFDYAANHSTFEPLTDDEMPSDKWVLLSFCPSNPWNKSSSYYQCRFDVRFKLLSRNAQSEHVDGEYCARILKHLRHLAVELKSKLGLGSVIFLHGDDKASFKIGEPGDALAVVERSKGSWGGKRSVQASQHDFASFKGNPSVWLVTDIPDDPAESFYRGQVYVSVKDAVFEASSPFRHATEMHTVLQDFYKEQPGMSMKDLKALLLYTDGGPDHNVKFATVWLAHICLFLAADLDFLVAARTCPTMSWKNVVEKIMCVLNLALYGVVLVRSAMGDLEDDIKAASGSMASIRAAASTNADLMDACKLSIQPVKDLLHSRFKKLDLKGKKFKVFEAATQDEIETMLSFGLMLDVMLPTGKDAMGLKSADLHKSTRLSEFIRTHFAVRDYFVVIGKYCQQWNPTESKFVKKIDCAHCRPVKMAGDLWADLSTRDPLLPDPEPMNGSWLKYSDLVLLRKTSNKYQPTENGEKPNGTIKNRKALLKPQNVRSCIQCSDCKKQRCIYSVQELQPCAAKQLLVATQDVNYTCGTQPLPMDHTLRDGKGALVVDDLLSCTAPMEINYFHDKRPKVLYPPRADWPTLCYHCGSSEGATVDQAMLESDKYSLVTPICSECRAKGRRVKATVSTAGQKQCSAPSGRKRTAEEAELVAAERLASRRPVPERDAGEDVVEQVVGKKKQGVKKFIYWAKRGGGQYGKDTCTWESLKADLDPDFLIGKRVHFRYGQSTFAGVIKQQVGNAESTQYLIEFDSRRHSNREVDLELPNTVSNGEYSWWRLDGYETNDEDEED